MTHQPRKRFGQNFLQNQMIIEHILQALQANREDNVIEIGPGLGALTKPLLSKLTKLTAIEIDRDLQAHLALMPGSASKLTVIAADALTIDYSKLGHNLRIIGNLPYNISTALLIHLLGYLDHIDDMLFMLQKEVVVRLAAKPGSKSYGRLSIITQYYCQVEHLFDVPADAFYPRPKVESAIVSLVPYHTSPYGDVPFNTLERIVATAFAMRRKTLANNLKSLINAEQLNRLGIDPQQRPEQVSINEYVTIAKSILE
ncbi:MAG: 16S rRNA (adenine(1518)-N(6)/adenine(1519)-N(6))-dimethyltransferase RsmA [Legionella sp.]